MLINKVDLQQNIAHYDLEIEREDEGVQYEEVEYYAEEEEDADMGGLFGDDYGDCGGGGTVQVKKVKKVPKPVSNPVVVNDSK